MILQLHAEEHVQYQGRDSLDVCLKVFRCVELLQYAQLLIMYA